MSLRSIRFALRRWTRTVRWTISAATSDPWSLRRSFLSVRLAIRALALAAALAALAWGAIGSGSDSGPGEPVMSEAQLEAECRRAIPETERLAREAERETGLPAHGIPEEACDY